MRVTASTVVAASVLLASLLLTACSVRLVDPANTDSGSNRTEANSTPAPDRTSTESASPESPPAEAPAGDAARRQELLDAATTTMPCPDVPLQQDGAVIRVEGACDELRIDSDAAAVIVDDVAILTLTGDGTVVYANDIGEIRVSGSANAIHWLGETPQVTDSGSANTLRRG